ncbi:MAG: dephospho-CoA kinase [Ruminococcus sp.]|nr:dephospho-CoA kinase [Ruminococcus sp.]
MKNHIIAGLTGQSGAGKTMVSNFFSENGFAVINCDEVARNVTKPHSDCNKELAELFPCCFDDDLNLDRQSLARIVFNDKESLEKLNATIFPYITRDIEDEIKALADSGEKYILLDAPTLFEAGANKLCDVIISCVADRNIRALRIAKRDNIPAKLIESRFNAQKSQAFFEQNSDYIIENNSEPDDARSRCKDIIEDIKRKFNG